MTTTIKYQLVQPIAVQSVPSSSIKSFNTTVYYYSLLLLSIVAISCSGTLQRELSATPPLLRAFWRLLSVSIALLAPFVIQLKYYTSTEQIQLYKQLYSREWLYIVICGVVTAIHFGSWIVSLDYTSFTHSLTLVSIHPLLLTLYYIYIRTKLSVAEYSGVVLGTIGTVILCAGLNASIDSNIYEHTSTWYGDLIATLGAVTLVINMLLGQIVRRKFNLFLFVFPVTVISTIPLLIGTCLFEHTCNISTYNVSNTTQQLFGFVYTPQLYYMILVVLGPGLCGHTVMNYLLLHINPLSISVGFTCEPILGTLIGVLFGVAVIPDIYSVVGGIITIVASVVVTIASYKREQAELVLQKSMTDADNLLSKVSTTDVNLISYDTISHYKYETVHLHQTV